MSKMEFDCKLAHASEIKRISNFNSIKELYLRISQLFSIPIEEILYCTLNTHDFRNMDALLGNYLSLGDLIIVHICGKSKEVNIKKAQEFLGLTITDNGHGRAFIKKINPSEEINTSLIKAGDHIVGINSESTVGLRHYEVAKAIREVPQHTYFTMHLLEPLHSENYLKFDLDKRASAESDGSGESSVNCLMKADCDAKIAANNNSTFTNSPLLSLISPERGGSSGSSHNNLDQNSTNVITSNLESLYEDLTNSSLPIDRLLSKSSNASNATNGNNQTPNQQLGKEQLLESNNDSYRLVIDKINSILESFLGINDNTLAIQIYRLAKENKDSYEQFVGAIRDSELRIFSFGENIESYLWNCVCSR